MDKKAISTAAEARSYAIEWQDWQSKQSLSWGEMAEWAEYFRKLGKRFHLTAEFRENGII